MDGRKLENVSGSTSVSTAGKRTNFIGRIKGLNKLFVLTVAAPTLIATLYYGLIASDIYVSESRFVVRSAQRAAQPSAVGALLQGTGLGRGQDDTYPVVDYIQSRDALTALNRDNYVRDAYSKRGDFISHFNATLDGSFESLWKYYGKRIVSVNLESSSGIATLQVRGYTAEDAQKINAELLGLSEQLVNRMNDRAAKDTVSFAQRQVDEAAAKAKEAAVALAAYRNSNAVFDPEKQSALQLQQVTSLQSQLFSAQTQLRQLQVIAPQNPQISVLKNSIAELEKQIKEATGGVAGGKNSLSNKAASYTRLQLDSQFADKQLASALAAMETARAEAQRQQLYLERLVQPNQPDVAIEPKRLKSIFEVFALGMIAWGILSLLLAGVREHHD
ncbi:Vi polysaccharide export inner membrane protein VexD [Burkholderia oklahomensis]|nr:Vi polysaccharide export inner membrane protein VexD [Burkholderia oklahomensis]